VDPAVGVGQIVDRHFEQASRNLDRLLFDPFRRDRERTAADDHAPTSSGSTAGWRRLRIAVLDAHRSEWYAKSVGDDLGEAGLVTLAVRGGARTDAIRSRRVVSDAHWRRGHGMQLHASEIVNAAHLQPGDVPIVRERGVDQIDLVTTLQREQQVLASGRHPANGLVQLHCHQNGH
jgi:hypothetical protein